MCFMVYISTVWLPMPSPWVSPSNIYIVCKTIPLQSNYGVCTIKICFLLESSFIGGAERHALSVIRALRDVPDLETHLILTDREGQLTDKFKNAADRYTNLQHLHNPNRLFPFHRPPPNINVLKYIEDYIKIHDIDLVHMFNGIQYIFAIPSHTPVVLQLGGDYSRDVCYHRVNLDALETDNPNRKDLTVKHVNSRKKTLILSDYTGNRRIYPKYVYFTNYVPYWDINGVTKQDRSVLWVGRLSEEKNPDLFLEVADKMPDYHFYFVFASETDTVTHMPLPDNVELRVNVLSETDLAILYERCELLLNTSTTEGEPLAITEGKSHGCFVIGTAATAFQSDHIVHNRDLVEGFVDAIVGFNNLSSEQKLHFQHKNRKHTSPKAQKMKIANLVKMYKGML